MLTKADFVVIASEDIDQHVYRTLRVPNDADLLGRLADEYVRLRTEPRSPLSNVVVEGIEILGETHLRRLLVRATTPSRRPGPFDVARADFGELLGYIALRDLFGTRFGWLPLRDREIADQPARGADLIGVETDPIETRVTVVLHQTKVSEEAASPPRVVDATPDSLSVQHLAYIEDPERAARLIFDAARRAEIKDVRDGLLLAGLYVQGERRDKCRVIVSSSLVRTNPTYKPADYGSFRSSPQRFLPSPIRFLIICIGDSIDDVLSPWYEQVVSRGEEQNA